MKTYPKGTKWAIRATKHDVHLRWACGAYAPAPTVEKTRDGGLREIWTDRSAAWKDLCRWNLDAALEGAGVIYRLVVIRPRVDHKAEAERLRAAIMWAVERLREPTVRPYGKIELVRDRLDGALSGSLRPSITPPDPARKEKTT